MAAIKRKYYNIKSLNLSRRGQAEVDFKLKQEVDRVKAEYVVMARGLEDLAPPSYETKPYLIPVANRARKINRHYEDPYKRSQIGQRSFDEL